MDSFKLEDLAHLSFVATPLGTMSRTLLEDAIANGVHIHIVVDSPHRQSVIPLVLDGVGAAILPGAVADRARQQGAHVVALDPPFRFPIKLIHPRSRLAPVAREFVRIATRSIMQAG